MTPQWGVRAAKGPQRPKNAPVRAFLVRAGREAPEYRPQAKSNPSLPTK